MKTSYKLILSTVALASTTLPGVAQDNPAPGGGGGRGPRPAPPLMAALDANKDGEIDATEMSNAAAALKTLDKNGDGKLTGEEIRPPRGERGPGGGRRAGGGAGGGAGAPGGPKPAQ